ncbi:MAG: hypothetical protein WCG44_00125 [bacterium]
MLGDTEIDPSLLAPPVIADVPPTPVLTPPVTPPKPKVPVLPLVLGFLIVIILAAVFGVVYYKNKLVVTSTPSPSAIATPSLAPSLEPSSTPSASLKSSAKPSSTPVSAIKITVSPTPTPVALPTLDVRFGNPSVNIKQTYDDGLGAGRVINREYTSIQTGQFDEVSSSWSPRVTTCFHIVSNEEIKGSDLKFTFTLDDKVEVEDNLGGYDKLEPGRLYDWCRDTTSSIGKHTARLSINPSKSLKESNYNNDLARVDWENLADKIAPNYTLIGPTNTTDGTCFVASYVSDNVTAVSGLKYELKQDGGDWQNIQINKYCLRGVSGSSHSMSFKISDARGNANEQSRNFVLY